MSDVVIVNADPPVPEPAPAPAPEPEIVPIPVSEPVPIPIPIPIANDVLDNRLQSLETRMNILEAGFTDVQSRLSNAAEVGHSHELPQSVARLAEHLDAIDQEEQLPQQKRGGILHKRLWGSG